MCIRDSLEVETRKWIFFWLGYPGLVAGALFLAPTGLQVGMKVESGQKVAPKVGNAMPCLLYTSRCV